MFKSDYTKDYRREAFERTLRMGRIMAAIGIPSIVAFAVQDAVALGARELIPYRLAAFIPMVALLVISLSALRRRPVLVRTAHIAALTGVMVMMSLLTIHIFAHYADSELHKMGVISGYIAAVVVVFVFGSGLRQLLPLVLGVPFLALLVVEAFVLDLPAHDIAYLSNPGVAILAILAVAYTQEQLQYKEFIMRRLAQKRRAELEIEINHMFDTNQELEREIADRLALERQLEEQATKDGLTGVLNRRAGMEILERLLEHTDDRGESLTICFVDVDNLKLVNDQYGHTEGDALIVHVARELIRFLRRSDYVVRMGGDEFVVILPSCDGELALDIMHRVNDEIGMVKDRSYSVSFSFGIAEYDRDVHTDPSELLKEADTAMYINKQTKKRSNEGSE